MSRNLIPRRYTLYDTNFQRIAQFDRSLKANYTKEVNGLGSFSFSLSADDPRTTLFGLDCIFTVENKISGWRTEYVGLHRSHDEELSDDGQYIFTSMGVGLNDFLARTIINYPAATIKSYKECKVETAMKQYVEENCGPTATVVEGREVDGVLPDFSVEADLARGSDWEGDRAYQSLLDVEKELSLFSSMDFDTVFNTLMDGFTFKVFPGQMGLDRSIVGLNAATGLNSAGNVPVIFSRGFGNLKSYKYTNDRTSESNSISVLGDGDGATRLVKVRTDPTAISASRWNRREVSRPQGGFESDMENFGDASLKELAGKEIIGMVPIQIPSCMYTVHYDIGDIITVRWNGQDYSRRIISISNPLLPSGEIQFNFASTPR